MVAVGRMGFQQLSRRWQTGIQVIQSNGITYNVYGDPQGKERPWPMDPIPLIIAEEEWVFIERAIAQRAQLLDSLLRDLYGPQELIHENRYPPALLYGNPHFPRPAAGIVPRGGVFLHAYAADLARSPDGRWWVITDRTQSPSGMGYALENRLVSARVLPNVFSQYQVRQLGRYFDAQRNGLLATAANGRSSPRMVLLTPGPNNETYFEHAFQAKYWGLPLVEGADLTVRDNRVYLKTLAGLDPVDLILRRLDDSYCDPLELRSDSLLGVPGLMQAVRSGTVTLANAVGSGLMETPAQMAFLPGLCQRLLGEELLMPSVATWWCGQDAPLRYVLDHLEEVVIKPAFARLGHHPYFPASMPDGERRELAHRIQAEPEQFVAQEQVALSSAPVRTDTGLVPRHVSLRVFAAWDGQGYTVMPGGLTRVSTADQSLVVTMQQGGGSKDTWVLGSADEHVSPSRPMNVEVDARRNQGDLPSRVADNLYWLGRYTERVEGGVRLVRVLLPGLSGEEDFGRSASLDTCIRLLTGLYLLPPESPKLSLAQQRWQVQRLLTDMVYDPARISGLGWNLKQIRRLSWRLKERLSADTWRVLQELETEFARTPPAVPEQPPFAEMNLLDHAIFTLSAFAGLLMENMTRGHGWRFLDIGRRIERALQMVELLRSGIAQAPADLDPYLEMLLQIADSSITYRTRYLTTLRAGLVLDLLLADEGNPRSVAFQLSRLQKHVEHLPERDETERYPLEQRLVLKALASVRLARLDDLALRESAGQLGDLERLLKQLRTDLTELSEALTAKFLSHLTPSRLSGSAWD
ncbi:MAG: circularly permuted type 2 ATP-grasp protein [Bryobacterales bacterium]|nr:circularly permuted type 2 ATP-grasp protein [Bryobacterales bacterium]